MSEFINSSVEFFVSILAMIGVVALFLAWGHFAEKRYEESDETTKKKISERRGIIFSIVIALFVMAVIIASISSIFL